MLSDLTKCDFMLIPVGFLQEWEDELWTIYNFVKDNDPEEHKDENSEEDDDEDDDEDDEEDDEFKSKLSALFDDEWKCKNAETLKKSKQYKEISEFLDQKKKTFTFKSVRGI